jgi:hypothetical protein
LRTIILRKLSFVISAVQLNLLKDPFSTIAYGSDGINGIISCDSHTGVADTFSPGLLGTMHIEQLMATILHADPISQDNPIGATSNHNIILLIPRNALNLAGMTREGHARWVLPSVEFENVQQVA